MGDEGAAQPTDRAHTSCDLAWALLTRWLRSLGLYLDSMKTARTFLALACSLASLGLGSGPASAQVVRARILQALEVHETATESVLELKFTTPIRYLRHAPGDHGDVIEIQLDLIDVSSTDVAAALARESLRLSRNIPVPLTAVTYDGTGGEIKVVELRFARALDFRVQQGRDFRSIEIRVARPPPPPSVPVEVPALTGRGAAEAIPVDISDPYALQLYAGSEAGGLPDLPPLPVLDQKRLYTQTLVTGEQRWLRLRLGFFASKEAAEAARAQLLQSFPDSFVVAVSGAERVASRETAIRRPGTDRAPSAATASVEEASALTDVQQQRADRWIQEAREALTAGDLPRAINRLTAVMTLPANDYTREARELLGLARERNGQLAHAKAEYEAYLELYPDDEAAVRVRQRLDALLTMKARPKEELRDPKRAPSRYQSDVVGSLATTYYRIESQRDDPLILDPVLESSIFTDIYLSAYMRGPRFQARSLAAGSHRHGFRDSGRDDFRFSSLEVELADEVLRLQANLGRQSQSGGGVLGRFDGAMLGYEFRDGWTVRAVGGFPMENSYQMSVQTRRYFVGGSIEARELFDSLRVELFGIGQKADGLTDRAAVGAEIQYWNDPLNVTSYLDYDVYFNSLNIAYLVGSWRATTSTTLNALFDYRNSPILTASSAVQGQAVRHVGDLLQTYDEAQIRDLARDRTARSMTATLGASHRFTDRIQLAGDVSGTHYSGTASSGGVIGLDGLGWEFNYFAQLIVSSLFMDDDIETVGFRYFQGNTRDLASLMLISRLNLTSDRSLRLYPRLTINFDRQEIGNHLLSVLPSVRLDCRIWKLSLDLEGGLNWTTPLRQSSQTLLDPHRLEYLLRAGVRLDF